MYSIVTKPHKMKHRTTPVGLPGRVGFSAGSVCIFSRDMDEETHRLRLFPLGTVLFPGLPLPLHIFEDRYKQMIQECLEEEEPFGLVYAEGANLRSIGCSARTEDIVKRYDDGKLDLIVRGERRFRLVELDDDGPYAVGIVRFIEDQDLSEERYESLVKQTISQLDRLARITGSEINLEALGEMDPQRISWLVSGLDAFSQEEKQYFLEISSTSQRLLACVQALANIVQAYDIGTEARELLPEGKLIHRLN